MADDSARWVLALVAIGVIASVAYTMRPREVVAPPPQIEALRSRHRHQDRGRRRHPLKAGDRDITRRRSRARPPARKARPSSTAFRSWSTTAKAAAYVVTGKEAFLGKQNSSFDVRGDVKLETSDGLTATGQQATYTESEKIVRVPGPVKFNRGRMSGSGVGFTYDEQRDTMWILDQADVKFAADKTAGADGLHRRRVRLRAPRSLHALRADHAHGSRRAS